MVETITTTLQDELEAQHFDEPIRERLSACLPVLEQAIASWRPTTLQRARPDDRGGDAALGRGSACRRLGEPLDEFDHELAVRAVAKAASRSRRRAISSSRSG